MTEKHYPTDPAGELDAGGGVDTVRRALRRARCCERVVIDGRSGWCVMLTGHRGPHDAQLSEPPAAPSFMPKGAT